MTGSGFTVLEEDDMMETTIAVAAAVVDTIGSAADCPCSLILTLTRTDSTHFRVTFDRPVENNAYLTITGNWRVYDDASVAPDLSIFSVTPEAVADPTYVDIRTSEQRTGVDYRVHAYILETA